MLKEVVLLLSLVITGSHQQKCFSENDAIQFVSSALLKAWILSQHNFTVSLLKVLNNERSGLDVVFSPACVSESLMITYFGAAGKTEAALAKILQVPDNQTKATTWRFYKNQKVTGIKDVHNPFPFKIANRMFLSDTLQIRPCMKQKFKRELELIDYRTDERAALNYINSWVEKQTRGHVKSLLTDLSHNTTATLVNAVYFKAKWEEEFEMENSTIVPFRVSVYETRNIKMMYKKSYFDHAYIEDIRASSLLLPYRKKRMLMAFLLPDQDLEEMIALLDENTLDDVTNQRKYKSVFLNAYIPKISYSTKIDLVNVTKRFGFENTFNHCANFSWFTGKREVFVNSMIHQSVIRVEETGSEATETIFMGTKKFLGPGEPLNFILDRPFVYIIYDMVIKKTLFIGIFRNPEPIMITRRTQ